MKNYRTPFLLVLIANIVLIAALASFWWRSHHSVTNVSAPAPAPAPPQEMTNPTAAPRSVETPLSPIQLSPERMQSIGVEIRRRRAQASERPHSHHRNSRH